jgi:hypothetical protein
MSPRTLALEIVTPDGMALQESGVDVVVLHRRERRFEPGSEIAVFRPRASAGLSADRAARYYRRASASTWPCGGSPRS